MTTAAGNAMKSSDLEVLQKLHEANQMEISMGHMAADKGTSKAVKAFGRRLVSDHTLAEKNVADYLKKRGLDLASLATTTSADPAHTSMADQSGPEFDRTFASQMVIDHQKTIVMVEEARKTTSDPQLKSIYSELLPTLRAHKKTAQDLAQERGRV